MNNVYKQTFIFEADTGGSVATHERHLCCAYVVSLGIKVGVPQNGSPKCPVLELLWKQMRFSVHCIHKIFGLPGRKGRQEEHLYQVSFGSNCSVLMVSICCRETILIRILTSTSSKYCSPTAEYTSLRRNYHSSLRQPIPDENKSQNNV